jgi:GNAT superfamily N-acetyltransferase
MNDDSTGPALTIRRAARADVPAIVRLLADDPLGSQREHAADPLPASYYAAFAAIDADPRNELVVAELDGQVIGTLQLTLLPYLTFQGGTRAQIEAVRVDQRWRSRQIGRQLFEWAIARARDRGCHMVQLTTNASRPEARRFYERLGFVASHVGMKLALEEAGIRNRESGVEELNNEESGMRS